MAEEFEEEQSIEDVVSPSATLDANDTKQAVARRIIRHVRAQLDMLERVLNASDEESFVEPVLTKDPDTGEEMVAPLFQDRTVEGVFDGEHMIGEDGRKYTVPSNYASKSKLVEGDLLRLTIDGAGRFIFKQRGPIDRQRLVGTLVFDEQMNEWRVMANGEKYRVLTASVTYYQGEPGDEVVILVPRNTPSSWAAVENILKADLSDEDA